MENQFRPIPLTIVDLLAALVPGFVWVVLLCCTYQLFNTPVGIDAPDPKSTVLTIIGLVKSWDPWLGSLYLLFASLSVGWTVKPFALPCAESFSKYLISLSADTRRMKPKDFRFPFRKLFQSTESYQAVLKLLQAKLKLDPLDLPGAQPFTASRRYLRLVAPVFWEESERIEAEVRMLAGLTIAAIYSFFLQAVVLLLHSIGHIHTLDVSKRLWWLLASLAFSMIFAHSFNRLRIREVGYAYHNVIVAAQLRSEVDPSGKSTTP